MKERERFFQVKRKTTRAARQLLVSLDRADNVIEGAPYAVFACGAFEFGGHLPLNPSSDQLSTRTPPVTLGREHRATAEPCLRRGRTFPALYCSGPTSPMRSAKYL